MHDMPPTNTFPLVDRALKGRLTEILTDARTTGESYEQIARKLSSHRNVDVSSTTIRRWCLDLGIDKGAA